MEVITVLPAGRVVRSVGVAVVLAVLLVGAAASGQEVLANGRPIEAGSEDGGDDSDLAHLLQAVADARVVHLVGDDPQAEDLLHRVRGRLIRFLSTEAGFDVLVLPVGIFEGTVTDTRLRHGAEPAEASEPLYRVWRENESFLEMLAFLAGQVEMVGGLCRFHATGKALYSPHLIELFREAGPDLLGAELQGEIERLWSGPSRLSRASPEMRSEALALADRLLARFDEVRSQLTQHHGARRVDLERHLLVNMRTFVELEQWRAGDAVEGEDLRVREKRQNLDWFLNVRFPSRRLVYWEGRGDSVEPLPTAETVFRILLEVRAPAAD